MSSDSIIAIVGATGAVGREALTILASWRWPACRVRAFASSRSHGVPLAYGERKVHVERYDAAVVGRAACAVLCVYAGFSRAEAPRLAQRGATVIDASAAFRLDPAVPLVIPEVNGDALVEALRASAPPAIIASPNCSTILLLMTLEPLRRRFGVREVVVCTYQAVSGAGRRAMRELREQTLAALEGRALAPAVFPESCAFNLFPHESPVDDVTGFNREERKMIEETMRIWGAAAPRIEPACVRVPVLRAHSFAVALTLARPALLDEAQGALRSGAGLRLIDDARQPPTPARATGIDEILVGRVRAAPGATDADGRTVRLLLWACGDQLRKGAALNALQIAALARPDLGLRPAPRAAAAPPIDERERRGAPPGQP